MWLFIFAPLMNKAHVSEDHMQQDHIAPVMPIVAARISSHISSAKIRPLHERMSSVERKGNR
jgi:hypothetical protein